jgi:hypothetical protein
VESLEDRRLLSISIGWQDTPPVDNQIVYGQTAALTAKVSDTTLPQTVQFINVAGGADQDLTRSGVITDADGNALLNLSKLAVGTYSIVAQYGDGAEQTKDPIDVTIVQAETATTLTSTSADTSYGQGITLTATVSIADPGGGRLNGSVKFFDGDTLLATRGIRADGMATLRLANLSVNTHEITAEYVGTTNFEGSKSDPVEINVNAAETITKLVGCPNPVAAGRPVTFTAYVMPTPPGKEVGDKGPAGGAWFQWGRMTLGLGMDRPTGEVAFYVDYEGDIDTLDTTVEPTYIATLSHGRATYTADDLKPGSHTVIAVYRGDGNYATSTSNELTQNVVQYLTRTQLTAAPARAAVDESVTFTATITPKLATIPDTLLPITGTVEFFDGKTSLGPAVPVEADGKATLVTKFTTAGLRVITAKYSGDSNYFGGSVGWTIEVVGTPRRPSGGLGGGWFAPRQTPAPSVFDQAIQGLVADMRNLVPLAFTRK